MREKNLEELLLSTFIAAGISIFLTHIMQESWQTFAGMWILLIMIVWGFIDKRRP